MSAAMSTSQVSCKIENLDDNEDDKKLAVESVAKAMNKTVDELNELAQKIRSNRRRSTRSVSSDSDKRSNTSKSRSRQSRSRSEGRGSPGGRRRSPRSRRRSGDRPFYRGRDRAYRSYGRGSKQFNRIVNRNQRNQQYEQRRNRFDRSRYRDNYQNRNTNVNDFDRSKGLSERFRKLTYKALNSLNETDSSNEPQRSPKAFNFSFFAITNQAQIPTTTLYRQAKEIVIVIERKIPKDKEADSDSSNINYTFDPERSHLHIDHLKDLKVKMQFSKAENLEDELVEKVRSILRENDDSSSKINNNLFGEGLDLRDLNFHPLRNQLMGSLAMNGGNAPGGSSKPSQHLQSGQLDPTATPKNNAYFLHDDRMKWKRSGPENRRFHDRRPYNSRRFDRDAHRSRRRRSYSRDDDRRSRDRHSGRTKEKEAADKWGHDKFYEVEKSGDEKESD